MAAVYLEIMREVARGLGVRVPTAETALATARAVETKRFVRAAQEGAENSYSAVKSVIDRAPQIPNLRTAEASRQYAPPFHISAGHSIEVTPIGEIIKAGGANPEVYTAARAAALRSEAVLPRAMSAVEQGEKAPPLVDLVRDLAKGAKYEGAVVTKKDGTTLVNFEEGLFKGTQAVIDDSTILIERGARLTEHSLVPHAGFQKMGNTFVNG